MYEAYPNGSIPQIDHVSLRALKPDTSRQCIKTMRICLLMHDHLSHFRIIASSDVESVVTFSFSSDSNEDDDDLNNDDDDDLDDDAIISLSEDDNSDEDGDTSDLDDEDEEDILETGRID